MREIKALVYQALSKDKLARCNDIYLFSLVLPKLNLPTDLKCWDSFDSNVLESIRRCRQKIQREQPMLRAEETYLKRLDREADFIELAKSNE